MRKIWAVARHMIAQGARMRVAAVVAAIFVVLVPSLPFLLKGDGTLLGQVQVFITYSLISSTMLLSVLTLTLSTASLCGEIRDKQIFILDTKPIARWQILAGKWLGIMAINLALLAFMGGTTYGFLYRLTHKRGDLDPEAHKTAMQRLDEQVLCARRSVRPVMPDLEELVHKTLRRGHSEGRIPGSLSDAVARDRIRKVIRGQLQSVPFGVGLLWRFEHVPRGGAQDSEFSLRFKYNLASGGGGASVNGFWRIAAPDRKGALEVATRLRSGSFHEFGFPARLVSPKGELVVQFVNRDDDRRVLSFPLEDGLEVLASVGSFGSNFCRGLVVVALKLGFMALAGLFCSTFLTLPVAVTLALCIYLLTGISGFIADMAESPWVSTHHDAQGPDKNAPLKPWFEGALRVYLRGVSFLVPPFQEFSVVPKLNSGREISWSTAGRAFMIVLLLRGGLLAAAGAYMFRHRELAGLES